ncbi:alanine racemase [Puniceicoccaceae bacterium]|nr:alanine racemase [Puniceicoccaceae bacterium]MDC0497476.1 alanine racemase [bacterium]
MDADSAPRDQINSQLKNKISKQSTGTPHRCWAEIDLAAFERNLKRIQAALPTRMRYVAVVKADAYGHGMPQIVRRLMQSGVDYFAVANVAEAAEIHHMSAGWPILLLSPLLPEEDKHLIEKNLTATVSSLEECERLSDLGQKYARAIKIHLKVDTGMGRLGIWHEEALSLLSEIANFPGIKLEGIYTHFSSAESDSEFTEQQRARFLNLLNRATGLPEGLIIHADNSAGIESLNDESPFNAVRIGLLQFGITSYPESVLGRAQVEPIFSFHARIGLIKELPMGTDISYGRTHQLKRDSTIAVLTAGYGDGVPLELGDKGTVLLHGQRCPILGRVTMDQTIIDITDCTEAAVADQVTLIGKNYGDKITTVDFSQLVGTIPWEALCSITKRVTRVYVGSREL